jgi:hypothetical protein
MPAIPMNDEERESLFRLSLNAAPPGEIPPDHASRFVALGLAVRETLRLRITLRGQVEILRQNFRKMPLSRVATVSKKHFLATLEERFSDRPLLGKRKVQKPASRPAPAQPNQAARQARSPSPQGQSSPRGQSPQGGERRPPAAAAAPQGPGSRGLVPKGAAAHGPGPKNPGARPQPQSRPAAVGRQQQAAPARPAPNQQSSAGAAAGRRPPQAPPRPGKA